MKPRHHPPLQRKPLRLGAKSIPKAAFTPIKDPFSLDQAHLDALYKKMVDPDKGGCRTQPLIGTFDGLKSLGFTEEMMTYNSEGDFWQTND